ncbi:MAG: diaminopimelate epimerase [Myxococcales bacterium]|nr:diaminopimelate epimerase [Myxococcales bacterium]MCB9712586.1 diaminopimelate epimerase [Myxococcales bacterium]
MPTMAFRKVEGLGNDFVLLDRRDATVEAIEQELRELSARAPMICNRRTGIGGDGILLLGPPRDPAHHATMWVINFDGSRPEMCGNGLRCVALIAAGVGQHTLVVDTDAGPRRCTVTADRPTHGEVEVDMGPGRSQGECSPAAAKGRPLERVSMGNPHAVSITDVYEDPEVLARSLGPSLERDPLFPEGTNVEFVRVQPDGSLLLWVWERGCGITDACGTGACATAVAVARRGLAPTDTPVAVHLPGGTLEIVVPSDPEAGVRMRGPARVVFEGTLIA